MKIRHSFVSNSSSSSFILFIKESDYRDVFRNLSNLEKILINHLKPSNVEIFDNELTIIKGYIGDTSSYDDFPIEHNVLLTEDDKKELEKEWGCDCILEKIIDKLTSREHFIEWNEM